ncbi:MAG: indole-3-glycerol phosphate synthase TrpC [Planctomycetota bacterium]
MNTATTGTVLDEIVRRKSRHLERLATGTGMEALSRRAKSAPPPKGFAAQIRSRNEIAIIAEIKKASPSKGVLCADLRPVRLAMTYAASGARAISVITEEVFFKGEPRFLERIREQVDLPLLRKDILIHPAQILEARALGADAVLLIASILQNHQLRELLTETLSLGMEALVEVHTEAELAAALEGGATLVGVNNRNLKKMMIDPSVAQRLCPMVPEDKTLVIESGVVGRDSVLKARDLGAHAVLVGEILVTAPDPASVLMELRGIGP